MNARFGARFLERALAFRVRLAYYCWCVGGPFADNDHAVASYATFLGISAVSLRV